MALAPAFNADISGDLYSLTRSDTDMAYKPYSDVSIATLIAISEASCKYILF